MDVQASGRPKVHRRKTTSQMRIKSGSDTPVFVFLLAIGGRKAAGKIHEKTTGID